jgi:hypothetical protein
VQVEQPGGVQTSGSSEDRLRSAQLIGKPAKHFGVELEVRVWRFHALRSHSVNRSLAANAATRRGVEVAPHRCGIQRHARDQVHAHAICAILFLVWFMPRGGDLAATSEQAFGEEESRRQLEVVTGGSHGDTESGVSDAYLERFFADEVVIDAA